VKVVLLYCIFFLIRTSVRSILNIFFLLKHAKLLKRQFQKFIFSSSHNQNNQNYLNVTTIYFFSTSVTLSTSLSSSLFLPFFLPLCLLPLCLSCSHSFTLFLYLSLLIFLSLCLSCSHSFTLFIYFSLLIFLS
jgi:hypothetical protein